MGVMGSIYQNGLGIERDIKKAESLYLEAYSQGDVLSSSNLVAVYEELGNLQSQTDFDRSVLIVGLGSMASICKIRKRKRFECVGGVFLLDSPFTSLEYLFSGPKGKFFKPRLSQHCRIAFQHPTSIYKIQPMLG